VVLLYCSGIVLPLLYCPPYLGVSRFLSTGIGARYLAEIDYIDRGLEEWFHVQNILFTHADAKSLGRNAMNSTWFSLSCSWQNCLI